MNQKRGQVSIFLILAVIMVVLAASVMFIKNDRSGSIVQVTSTTDTIVTNYLDSVYEQAVDRSILIWASSGGKDTTQNIAKKDFATRSIAYLIDSQQQVTYSQADAIEQLNVIIAHYFHSLIDHQYLQDTQSAMLARNPVHSKVSIENQVMHFSLTPHMQWESEYGLQQVSSLASVKQLSLRPLLEEVDRFITQATQSNFEITNYQSTQPTIRFCSFPDPSDPQTTLIKASLQQSFLGYATFDFDFLIHNYGGAHGCTS